MGGSARGVDEPVGLVGAPVGFVDKLARFVVVDEPAEFFVAPERGTAGGVGESVGCVGGPSLCSGEQDSVQ